MNLPILWTQQNQGSALEQEQRQYSQIGVSNSEVSALTCERAWLFGYHPQLKLTPKSHGVALTRGLLGHKVLEIFYLHIKDGTEYSDAVNVAMEYLNSLAIKAYQEFDMDKLDMIKHLESILVMYFEHYEADVQNWEILEVEAFHLLEWSGQAGVYLPMRLDLTIYQKSGKFKGETSPVDHKFTNDFWNSYKLRLNSQLPLYIRSLRGARFKNKNATVVRRSIVNQIRTRSMKNPYPHDIFRRSFIEANDEGMEKVFENHLKSALKIERLKRMPVKEAYEATTAAWGSSSCQFCFFKEICATDLEGGNTDMAVIADYAKSTYGYPTMEELQSER